MGGGGGGDGYKRLREWCVSIQVRRERKRMGRLKGYKRFREWLGSEKNINY